MRENLSVCLSIPSVVRSQDHWVYRKKLYLCPTTCWLIHGDFCSYLSNQIRHWELIRTPVFSKQSIMDIQRGFACLPSPCFFLPRVNGQIKHVVSVKNSDPEPRKLWFLDRSIGMVWVSDCVTGKMFWNPLVCILYELHDRGIELYNNLKWLRRNDACDACVFWWRIHKSLADSGTRGYARIVNLIDTNGSPPELKTNGVLIQGWYLASWHEHHVKTWLSKFWSIAIYGDGSKPTTTILEGHEHSFTS